MRDASSSAGPCGRWRTGSSASSCPPTCSPSASDRKSTRLNSSHLVISYAVFCLKKKIRLPSRLPPTRAYLGLRPRLRPSPQLHQLSVPLLSPAPYFLPPLNWRRDGRAVPSHRRV